MYATVTCFLSLQLKLRGRSDHAFKTTQQNRTEEILHLTGRRGKMFH